MKCKVKKKVAIVKRPKDDPSRRSSEYWDFFRDGINNTGLELFATCREQFRLMYVEGWRGTKIKDSLEFGSMIHWMDATNRKQLYPRKVAPTNLTEIYLTDWKAKRPDVSLDAIDQMEKLAVLAEALWPTYMETFGNVDRVKNWVLIEEEINYVYKLDCPLTTRLRGILDGLQHCDDGSLEVYDTKTMSQVSEAQVSELLPGNFQFNLYQYIVQQTNRTPAATTINVIRRPGQRQKVSESLKDFRSRISGEVEAEPGKYFIRLRSTCSAKSIAAWKKAQLEPMIAEMVLWVQGQLPHYYRHCNLLSKYGQCEMYHPILSGDFSECVREAPFARYEGNR